MQRYNNWNALAVSTIAPASNTQCHQDIMQTYANSDFTNCCLVIGWFIFENHVHGSDQLAGREAQAC